MDTKSYILPFEKIRQPTPFGDLETGVIPEDPYDPEGETLRPGRILVLKTKDNPKIIGYLPYEWQVTLDPEGRLRAHGPKDNHPSSLALEGHLQNAHAIDPWEECPEESPYLPWCTLSYSIPHDLNPPTTPYTDPQHPWQIPLLLNLPEPLLVIPHPPHFEYHRIPDSALTPFHSQDDFLTAYHQNNAIYIRALKLKKTWEWKVEQSNS